MTNELKFGVTDERKKELEGQTFPGIELKFIASVSHVCDWDVYITRCPHKNHNKTTNTRVCDYIQHIDIADVLLARSQPFTEPTKPSHVPVTEVSVITRCTVCGKLLDKQVTSVTPIGE